MEITYNLVKDLLEKSGYYTTDKVIWDTINNINKLVKGNKKGQDIHAVCLEGMPGSGKTRLMASLGNAIVIIPQGSR